MFDTLIVGGRVVDGTGNPWFYGDVALMDGRIARVATPGTITQACAKTVIDATGHVVCPGFIDIQSHSIIPYLTDTHALSKVTQGVTTEILGEDWTPAPFGGRITAPFAPGLASRIGEQAASEWDATARGWSRFGDWLHELETRGTSLNFGSFLGGSTVREFGMGMEMGNASPEALEAMQKMVADAMEDGAFGVATALIYPPNAFSTTDELISVMRVVQAYGGIHITHIRSEGDRLLQGLDEALDIARQTGVPTEIYHLKAIGPRNWSTMSTVIERITNARADGIDIAADMYPYEGAGTGLAACIPPWAQADGKRNDNLRDPDICRRMIEEMTSGETDWENFGDVGPDNILLGQIAHEGLKRFEGKTLAEVAHELDMSPAETILHLLRENGHDISTVYMAMSTENLALQARQPWIKWGTDAGGVDPAWAVQIGLQHPRAYGTYPRILGRFVRERGWITLEDAVRKGSSAVAERLGLRDRGHIREGMAADVVIFNPDEVIDVATYTDPHHLSIGIRDVFVNGTQVLNDGQHTGATPGSRLHGPGYGRKAWSA